MARWVVEDNYRSTLDALDDATQRRIRREMVENGAKVLQKEMQATIDSRHHVITGDMRNSIAPGKVWEDVDKTSIEIYPQNSDPRGVNNEMKLQIINYGYYNKASGKRQKKSDYFLNETFRKKCEPRILAVMNATLAKCMEELNK